MDRRPGRVSSGAGCSASQPSSRNGKFRRRNAVGFCASPARQPFPDASCARNGVSTRPAHVERQDARARPDRHDGPGLARAAQPACLLRADTETPGGTARGLRRPATASPNARYPVLLAEHRYQTRLAAINTGAVRHVNHTRGSNTLQRVSLFDPNARSRKSLCSTLSRTSHNTRHESRFGTRTEVARPWPERTDDPSKPRSRCQTLASTLSPYRISAPPSYRRNRPCRRWRGICRVSTVGAPCHSSQRFFGELRRAERT